MTPAEVIREARNVLFERGWSTGSGEADDGSVCVVGALRIVHGLDPNQWVAWMPPERLVLDRVVGTAIWAWNDQWGRTFDDVIDVLDRAEKIAEAREVLP